MRRIGLAAASVALAMTLGACSGDDDGDADGATESTASPTESAASSDFAEQPGADIAQAAKDAMSELTSMRVSGAIADDGDEITLDLQLASGGTCVGSLGLGGATVELLGTDGDTWMRPDAKFWTLTGGQAAKQVQELVGDRWVVIPAEEDSFNQFCDLDSLLEQMLSTDEEPDDDTTYTVTGTEDVDGVEVVTVESTDEDGDSSLGYIRVEAPHHLVKIERTSGDETGAVTFSDFDAEIDVQAPAESEIVDLDNLG